MPFLSSFCSAGAVVSAGAFAVVSAEGFAVVSGVGFDVVSATLDSGRAEVDSGVS